MKVPEEKKTKGTYTEARKRYTYKWRKTNMKRYLDYQKQYRDKARAAKEDEQT